MRAFFRDLLGTLQALVQVLAVIAERLTASTDESLAARVQELEASRALWEGEMQAAAVKIESRFNAARAAEERTRAKRRKGEDEEADLGHEAEAAAQQLAAAYAQGGAGSQVLSMHPSVAGDARAQIRARKWGRA